MSIQAVVLPLAIATAILVSGVCRAESPAEMLEKGIYAEETAGNLDEAIKIYRKVVADAKQAQTVAAQAQYRIAQCLLKQGKAAEAEEAFRRVVEEFPDQKELVAKAKTHLKDGLKLLPAPWKSGERLTFTLKLGALPIGIVGLAVEEETLEGVAVWNMLVRRFVSGGQSQGVSYEIVDRQTSRPLLSTFRHTVLGNSAAVWGQDKLVITTEGKMGKPEETKTIDLTGPVYSNDQWFFGFRQLPLEVGYKAALPIRVAFAGGNFVELEVEAVEKEKIEVAAGAFECFRLKTNIGQTFWVADGPQRYLVKFEAEGAVGEPASIEQGEPTRLESEQPGFGVTAPKGWFHYRGRTENQTTQAEIIMVAPEMASASVSVRKKSLLAANQQASPQAWAEATIKSGKDAFSDLAVRPEGLKDVEVANLPAVSFIVDYSALGNSFTTAYALAFADDKAVEFEAQAIKGQFEPHRDEFEAIRKSISLK